MKSTTNIYDLKCPLILNKDVTIEEQTLYQILELPVLEENTIGEPIKINDPGIINISKILPLNQKIELEEAVQNGHALKVAYLAKRMCDELKLEHKVTRKIYLAALFHDIGKILIPENIIGKPGKLTPEEFEIIKKHSNYAENILIGNIDSEVIEIIKQHHERVDGSGYPRGTRLSDIGGQILGIVDSYDAMTSPRVYNKPKTKEEAFLELELCTKDKANGGKGKLYNSNLVEILKKIESEDKLESEKTIYE